MACIMRVLRILCGALLVGWCAAQAGGLIGYKDVALSPDGARLAWVQKSDESKALMVQDRRTPGAAPVKVEEGATESPAWSPDSSRLVFVRETDGQSQLWVAAADGSGARALTSVRGYVGRPAWSADGKRIAFLHVEGGSGGGPLGALEAQVGEIGAAIRSQRVAVADAESGAVKLVSPAELHVYAFDWSRDGKWFVVTAAPGPGDNNWWVAQLQVVDAASGQARPIYKPKRQIAVPRWSPDGSRVAFIEGLMSDEGFHGGDLMTVDADGKNARNWTAGRSASPSWMAWVTPARLLFTEYAGGGSAIATADLRSGSIERMWQGAEHVSAGGFGPNFSLASDGKTSAVVRESFEMPPEVWAGPVGEWRTVTRGNAGQVPAWGRAESVEWTNEGFKAQGWLIHPREEKAGSKSPMVVEIHGGPSGVITPSWPEATSWIAAFTERGYFVFLPNPRGSYGQGEAFTRGQRQGFRRRRPARHPGGRGRSDRTAAGRRPARRASPAGVTAAS